MLLEIKRFEYGTTFTIGKLYINGEFHCYTLEDRVREVKGVPVVVWKIPGETAIPKGTYKLILDFSNRFQKTLPHILNVPGYEGVRIHSGNTSKDTEGCILVGKTWNGGDFVGGSRAAFDPLLQRLAASPEEVQIRIGDSLESSEPSYVTPIAHV